MFHVFQCLGLCLALVSGWAYGQAAGTSYPTKPVTLVVPFPPGASQDVDGRQWGLRLGEALGKPFVMDFKPGAGGIIGISHVVKSPPDGHTLLIISGSLTVQAATRTDLPFDPLKDLVPISMLNRRLAVLLVHPSLPIRDFSEYVAYAKARPGELNMGTNGPGAITHMMGAWLNSAAGVNTTFVHYKGTAPMLQDLVAGRVQVTTGSIATSSPFVKSGKLRPIALLGRDKTDLMPGMKTVSEQGLTDYDYSTWTGILGPAAMPSAAVNRLAAEMGRIAKTEEMTSMFAKDGTLAVGSSPAEFRKFLVGQITHMKRVAQEFNIKAVDD